MSVLPYRNKAEGKKEQVEAMFDNIASEYDFLNRFLSAGIDIIWRKRLVRELKTDKPEKILDVATGTADVALEIVSSIKNVKVTGVDLSNEMLEKGRAKVRNRKLENNIELEQGDSERLRFTDNNFDAVTVAYGVRNFENLEMGLKEMHRVLKPGGKLAVLEFSKPKAFPVKQLFGFYSKYILPAVGRLVSRDKEAYTYLPESVKNFPEGKEFLLILEKSGFKNCQCIPLTFGITSIYIGRK